MGLCMSEVLVYHILARIVECMSKSVLARMGLCMSEVLDETFVRNNGSVYE